MNNDTNQPRIETRAVLASAYADRSLKSCLTHAVEVDADHRELAVLCGRVELDHIADMYSEDPAATPTCKTCARKLAKLGAR